MVIKWEFHTSDDNIMPNRAIVGGKDVTGELIYVGRVKHKDFVLPAKVIAERKECFTSFDGVEIPMNECEVLCGDHQKFSWEPASNGTIMPNAVSTGKVNDEEVYVGRAVFEGSMIVGRVSESQKCIFLPFDGKEHSLPHYELLVYHPRRRSRIAWGSFGEIVFTE